MPATVRRVARAIFPEGKAVLVGYDAKGNLLIGVVVKAKSVARWALEGVSRADRKRVVEAWNEFLLEQSRDENKGAEGPQEMEANRLPGDGHPGS